MAQIPDIGFTVRPFRGSSGSPLACRFMGALVLLLLATSWVQAQNTPTSNAIGKNKPTIPVVSPVPPQEVGPPVVPPPPPPTAEQKPPLPPTVVWDGKQLTIDADNATLTAILVAVRERTGASIEVPGAASAERVFIHLGPGPARDIISSLVYGTRFDYIVETAEDDPDTLRKVVLTARGLGDSSSDLVATAGATNTGEGIGGRGSTQAAIASSGEATDGRARPDGVRMMRGWASSGKTTFQADAEAALAAQQAAKEQESAAAQDSVPAQDSAAAQGSATAQESAKQDSGPTQDSAITQESTAASAAAIHPAEDTSASNSSASSADSDDRSGVGQAIQNMTHMFEQRRQIQAQQNHTDQPPSSN